MADKDTQDFRKDITPRLIRIETRLNGVNPTSLKASIKYMMIAVGTLFALVATLYLMHIPK